MIKRTLKIVFIFVWAFASVMPFSAQEQDEDHFGLTPISTFTHGSFDEGAAEIAAYDVVSQRLFVTNAEFDAIDVLDIQDASNPELIRRLDISAYGSSVTSVAAFDGLVAATIVGEAVDADGTVVFYDFDGMMIHRVTVGVLPDMVVFSPDGTRVLTANEGEPNDDYSVDPLGSISIINLGNGIDNATVTTLDFEGIEIPEGVRIFGPNASAAQDIEPEYIAISPDGTTAFVSLQENNALAVIDIANEVITDVIALGYKDHLLADNALDGGKDDGIINIANWPLLGLYQPDGIAAYEVGGAVYVVTANEGDTRDYDGYSEESEIGEARIDAAFPDLDTLTTEAALLGLGIVESMGDTDGDGDLDRLYIPGARSFSIWSSTGELVYDSGADFERIIAEMYPDDFNSSNDENGDFDGRSDNKGPEPESVTIGEIDGTVYAFIVLERMGGIMVYDITDPQAPVFVNYTNNRDFSGDPEAGLAGDLGPESSVFIPADNSPTGTNLLVVSNEVSGTTTIFEITP